MAEPGMPNPEGAAIAVDPRYGVPTRQIPRLHYPSEIDQERFLREFAGRSQPCVIHGLLDDWPAHSDPARTWRGDRWDRHVAEVTIDASFDPVDSRIMHFGDDEGKPEFMFNPGRLRMPTWAFLEVGRIRQYILSARRNAGEGTRICLRDHPGLKDRLQREVSVQNVPFVTLDEGAPLNNFHPFTCRMRDLVPLAFYTSMNTFAFPRALQEDIAPLHAKLIPGWGKPDSSRIWVSPGGNWRTPFPPWSDESVPEPTDDQCVYSCFHCDRMENLHSVLAGEKEWVLVPPGQRDVLKPTRYAKQNQWLMAPIVDFGSQKSYLGSTSMISEQVMDFQSDQSAVHPLRSAEDNRRISCAAWPDLVDFPINVARLRKGDTLYIPPYHWHWVRTEPPPSLGRGEAEGAVAMSANFWWWPIHNDEAMERWSFKVEIDSWENRRAPVPGRSEPPERQSHAASFHHMTALKRAEAAERQVWPRPPEDFEVVD